MDGKRPADIPEHGNIPRRLAYPSDEARILLGGISEPQFRRLTGSGELVAKKIGRKVYVKADELDRFLDAHPDVHEVLAERAQAAAS